MKYILAIILTFYFWACADKVQDHTTAKIDGKHIFQKNCVLCHGSDGSLEMNGAKDLSKSTITLDQRITQITNGKNLMTPFKGILSEKEIAAVAEYTMSLKASEQ